MDLWRFGCKFLFFKLFWLTLGDFESLCSCLEVSSTRKAFASFVFVFGGVWSFLVFLVFQCFVTLYWRFFVIREFSGDFGWFWGFLGLQVNVWFFWGQNRFWNFLGLFGKLWAQFLPSLGFMGTCETLIETSCFLSFLSILGSFGVRCCFGTFLAKCFESLLESLKVIFWRPVEVSQWRR